MGLSWQASREQMASVCLVGAGKELEKSPKRTGGGRQLSAKRAVRKEGRRSNIAFAHGVGERRATACAMEEVLRSRMDMEPGSTSIVHGQLSSMGFEEANYVGELGAYVRSSKPRGSGGV